MIAVFYTAKIHFVSLAVALGFISMSFGTNLMGIRKPAVYAMIGICAWFAVLESGVHATVAGVLAGVYHFPPKPILIEITS